MVGLIINVAWGNEYLPDILETLKKHDVMQLFSEGRWVKENPRFAKMIVDAGHEIGNHSYTHPNMKTYRQMKSRDQLEKTNRYDRSNNRIESKMVCSAKRKFS